MSLIEEALRRVQETMPPVPVIRRSPAPQAPAHRTASAESAQDSSIPPAITPPFTLGGIGITALAVGLLIAASALTLRRPSAARSGQPAVASIPAETEPQPAPAAEAPAEEAAAPETVPIPEPPSLVLSGIALGSGDPVAIINGQILKIGDMIEGAVLADILPDAARVRWPDREVTIRLAR